MKFGSKFLSLSVYCDGKVLQFKNGEYETTEKNEIKTLKNAVDVVEVTEVKETEK